MGQQELYCSGGSQIQTSNLPGRGHSPTASLLAVSLQGTTSQSRSPMVGSQGAVVSPSSEHLQSREGSKKALGAQPDLCIARQPQVNLLPGCSGR